MNFSASIVVSVLLHGAIAVAVIAAPAPKDEPVEALDVFVEDRMVEFDPVQVNPWAAENVEVEQTDDERPREPDAPPEEPEPKTPDERPEEVRKPSPKPPQPPEEPPKAKTVEKPEEATKPIVAARESESAAEVTEVADASGGVASTSPTTDSGRRAATSNEDERKGAARGREKGDERVDRRALLRAWLKQIYVEVQKRQRYPRAARRDRQQGKVVLEVRIDPTGEIVSVEIARSSGHAQLDRAALQLIHSLNPVPAPPPALRWPGRPIKLPVTYRLR